MSHKKTAIEGFKWSFIDTFSRYFLSFFIGIVLARILSPEDYGLIGMTGIFIALSSVFIDGGFGDALIRKINPSPEDYSSVFFFNIITAIVLYLILFLFAPEIACFFNEDRLILIIRIVGIGLLISSLSTIHIVILRKRLDFKLQAIISFATTIISGLVSIIMAIVGYGVWSLVVGGLITSMFSAILLWIFNQWRPNRYFSFKVIKEHFNFGSKIMLGSFINMVYNNMYYVLIGKLFSPLQLGYYTKADNYQKLPVSTIDIIVRQVTYPLLSNIQNNENQLKDTYRTLTKTTSFLVFFLLFGLAAVAEPFIVTLIGEKWLPSVPYLQLLCFVGSFFPLISINVNILNVKGRSDLSLVVQIVKIFFSIPVLLLGFFYGISEMILGMIASSLFLYLIVMSFTSRMINYTIKEQLMDIGRSLNFGLMAILPVYFLSFFINLIPILQLIVLMVSGGVSFVIVGCLTRNNVFIVLKNLLVTKFRSKYFFSL